MKLHLHISLFQQRDSKRALELETCLRRNLEHPLLSRVTVLDEGVDWALLQHPKVRRIPTRARPRFRDFLPHLEANATNIISNNDIHFDSSLRRLPWLRLGENDLLALTRHEPDGTLFREADADSQDTWIFRGRPPVLAQCDFYLGTPGCDNRLLYLFEAAGYRTLNPSKVIRCWHLHASPLRAYDDQKDRIHGIYQMERPLGLWEYHQRRVLKYVMHRLRKRLVHTRLSAPAGALQAVAIAGPAGLGQPSRETPRPMAGNPTLRGEIQTHASN
jgi:hypothetical protein